MRRLRRLATVALITLGVGYLCVAAFFFAVQRRMLFQPGPPRPVHIAGAQVLQLGDARALWIRGDADKPVVVHFHGNAEQLADLGELADAWHFRGVGFLAVEYPGYGAPGSPSEDALYAAASDAIRYLRETLHVPRERTVLVGRSLGTGVATELASRGEGARLVLISPYTSIPDVAQKVVPFLPARLLVRDRLDSLSKAPRIDLPVLVLHGRSDEVIPFELGEKLARAFPHAHFVPLECGHNDILDQRAAWDALVPFVLGK